MNSEFSNTQLWADFFWNLFIYQFVGAIVLAVIILLVKAAKDYEKDSCKEALMTAHPSDKEFLKTLPDGMSPEVALRVRRIVAHVSGWDVEEIQLDTRFVDL